MRKISFLFLAFCFLETTNFNAQSLQILDENENVVENTTHYFYGENNNFGQSILQIKNLTGTAQDFAIKAALEYTAHTNSGAYFILDVGYAISANTFADQVVTNGSTNQDTVVNTIPANGIYTNPNAMDDFRFEPFSAMWTDCPNDSSIWRVTVFDPANSSDSSSVRIVFKCIFSPDPTSIEESSSNNSINTYPNPTNSKLHFSATISASLFDLLGKKVLSFKEQSIIDISHLKKGVYFLKTNNSTIKILKL